MAGIPIDFNETGDDIYRRHVAATIAENAGRAAELIDKAAILRDMLKDLPEPTKLTRWQKVRRLVRFMPERIRDAWLVLIGKAWVEREGS